MLLRWHFSWLVFFSFSFCVPTTSVMSNLLKDCRIVQLETTHSSRAAVYFASVHKHAWSVGAHEASGRAFFMHISFWLSASHQTIGRDYSRYLAHLTAHGGRLALNWAALAMTVAGKNTAARRIPRMKRIMRLNKKYSLAMKEGNSASVAWKKESTEEMGTEIMQALHSSPSLVKWV